jgi:hypothetical protein
MSTTVVKVQFDDRSMFLKSIGRAPRAVYGTMRHWMYRVRLKYVGGKKKSAGIYTNYLARRRLRGRDGTWSKRAAGAFKGKLKASRRHRPSDLILSMGLPTRSKRPEGQGFIDGLRMLATGGTIKSHKFMPIPVYKNTNGKRFADYAGGDQLVAARKNGQVYWLLDDVIESGGDFDDALAFVGVKRVTVKRFDYKFVEKFRKQLPLRIRQGQHMIQRLARGIERGRVREV